MHFMKTGCTRKISQISGFQNHLETKSNLCISIRQIKVNKTSLPWLTLYQSNVESNFPLIDGENPSKIPLVCRILVTNTNSHHIYLSLTDQGQAYQNESVTLLYVFCFLPIFIYVYYRGYSLRPPDCRQRRCPAVIYLLHNSLNDETTASWFLASNRLPILPMAWCGG